MNGQVKYRNLLVQVLLMIVTLGIYGIYWFHQTAVEMKALSNDLETSPGLLTFLMFIPFANLYAVFKWGELYSKIAPGSFGPGLILLLWLIFSPVVWFTVQTELNRRARPAGA